MKKILVAFAVVAIATCAHAVAYNWSVVDVASGYSSANNEENAAGTAYLYLNSGTTALDVISAAIAAGTFDATKYTSIASTTFNGMVDYTFESTTDYAASSVYSVFLATSVTSYADSSETLESLTSGQVYATTAITVPTAEILGSTMLDFGSQFDATSASGSWTAVPEPTSGVLLLLGMAGLALKRKRA